MKPKINSVSKSLKNSTNNKTSITNSIGKPNPRWICALCGYTTVVTHNSSPDKGSCSKNNSGHSWVRA